MVIGIRVNKMYKLELEAKLKSGKRVNIVYELDGYKPLIDIVEDINGNELNESQYDVDEVYQLVCDEAMDIFMGDADGYDR